MRMGTVGILALLFLAGACASPSSGTSSEEPARSVVRTTGFQTAELLTEGDRVSSTFEASPGEVWAILHAVYGTLGIPVTQVAPDRMTLGNPSLETRTIDGKRMSAYLDCGTTLSGRIADRYDVTLNLSTRVVERAGGGSEITTSVDAWAEPRVTRGDAVHCRSRGSLEDRISAVAAKALNREG